MKSTFPLAFLLALTLLMGCGKIELTETEKETTEKTDTTTADTTQYAQAYTVAELSSIADGTIIPLCGYIVGYAKSGKLTNSAVFSADGAGTSNIVLADRANETDGANCAAVELSDKTISSEINLQDFPEYLGERIVVWGTTGKYFYVPGIRKAFNYVFVEGEDEGGDSSDDGSGDDGDNPGGDGDNPGDDGDTPVTPDPGDDGDDDTGGGYTQEAHFPTLSTAEAIIFEGD